LSDWAAAGGGRGGGLVAADLLVIIRMLFFLTADFGCVTKTLRLPKIKQLAMSFLKGVEETGSHHLNFLVTPKCVT
jgi:hypothetical protein